MPLVSIEKLQGGTILGVWKICESLADLTALVPLSPNEHVFFSLRKTDVRQQQFLATRVLLDTMTGYRQPVVYAENGQPLLLECNSTVSFSHSGIYVAVALASTGRVGVDIELHPRKLLLKAKDYFLNEGELQWIDGPDTLIMLHVLWSAKEAVFKYAGVASLNMKTDINIDPFKLSQSGALRAVYTIGRVVSEVRLFYSVEEAYVKVVTG